MSQNIVPVFIVGSPRSGTTLTQSLLGSHSQLAAFPESRFFVFAIPRIDILRKLGIAGRQIRRRLRQYLLSMDAKDAIQHVPSYGIFIKQYTEAYVQIMEELTVQKGKNVWIDKTPRHLRYIPEIQRYIGPVKFIHIIRYGPDTIASFYQMTNQFPDLWGKAATLDGCIDSWIRDIRISQSYVDDPAHMVIRYDELVQHTPRLVQGMCRFIGVEYEEQILELYKETAVQVSWAEESWKESVTKPIAPQKTRFHTALSAEEQQHVLDRLRAVDLLDL